MKRNKADKAEYAKLAAIKEVKDPFENIVKLDEENDIEQKAYIIYEKRVNEGKKKTLAYLHDPFETEELALAALKNRLDSYKNNPDPKFNVIDNGNNTFTVESEDKTFKSVFDIKRSAYYYGMMRGADPSEFDGMDIGSGTLSANNGGTIVTFSDTLKTFKKQAFASQRAADEYKKTLAKNLQAILGLDAVRLLPDGSITVSVKQVTIK